MPKISDERKTERREQILAGARRCFAEYGYEGTTVVRLEQETGLSRGAIFNYFGSKQQIFLELTRRDDERLIRLWLEKGWEAAVREVRDEDPDWLGVYLELTRKLRTDPDFRREHEATSENELVPALVDHVRSEQERGLLRSDMPAERIAGFIGLVANGMVVQMAAGEPIQDVDALLEFIRSAVAVPVREPARSRTGG
jgi:TetR/AcrR family transcriptional regulator, transcriptional repressor of aconitase